MNQENNAAGTPLTALELAVIRYLHDNEAVLFDKEYYRAEHPFVDASHIDPFMHYSLRGWSEGRKPRKAKNALADFLNFFEKEYFDSAYYLGEHPEVRQSGVNPFMHFMLYGYKTSRPNRLENPDQKLAALATSKFFNPWFYSGAYPQTRAAGLPPLLHFLQQGRQSGLLPNREDIVLKTAERLEQITAGAELEQLERELREAPGLEKHFKLLYKKFTAGQIHAPQAIRFDNLYDLRSYAYQAFPERLEAVYQRLADFRSREVFACYILANITNNCNYFHYVYEAVQYRHPAVKAEPGDVIFDCGAYDGQTAIDFLDQIGGDGMVYSLEPGKGNLQILQENVRKSKYPDRIIPVNKGSWSSDTTLRFSADGDNPAAAVTADNTGLTIEAARIDTLVEAYKLQKVSLIKMDVERAELESLRGAVDTIRRFKPRLQICIYHQAEDWYTISDFIESLGLGYRQYLMHHAKDYMEAVLYATAGL